MRSFLPGRTPASDLECYQGLVPSRQARFKRQTSSTPRHQRMDLGKEDNCYSLLLHASSAVVRLLLVNGKLLEVVQRYLVKCLLVCGVEEDPACN